MKPVPEATLSGLVRTQEQRMTQSRLATRIDGRLKRAVLEACRARGVTVGSFVEDALRDRLEEILDAEDIEKLRPEPTLPFAAVVRGLERDGKL
jgi:uncharacterized protein (DUF1778 family)